MLHCTGKDSLSWYESKCFDLLCFYSNWPSAVWRLPVQNLDSRIWLAQMRNGMMVDGKQAVVGSEITNELTGNASGGGYQGWGNFVKQSPLVRLFFAKNLPMISLWLPSMIEICCKFPHPSLLILKQSLEFTPTQGHITHSIPLHIPLHVPLVDPGIGPWGKPLACALC